MDTEKRRNKIIETLKGSGGPVTASSLARQFSVSRQVIVSDIALLRAGGYPVTATPRGYVLNESTPEFPYAYTGIIACRHGSEDMKNELYTVVDYGGTVIDVTVEHSVYGQLSGLLHISSRYEADQFLSQVGNHNRPLSDITGGIHIHHIGCRDKKTFDIIRARLDELGITLHEPFDRETK